MYSYDKGYGVLNVKEWNEAVVNDFIDGKKIQHYFNILLNDIIYHNIPDNIIGFHAGDGYIVDYKFYDSNVEFNDNYNSIITINNDGYFEIDYVKSVIKVLLKNGEIPIISDINEQGIRVLLYLEKLIFI